MFSIWGGGHEDELVGYGYAFIDEVVCEYCEFSAELSQNRLELTMPDLLQEIDEKIYGVGDEDAAVAALAGLIIQGDPDDYDHYTSVVDAQGYIERALDFDTTLPYYLSAVGSLVVREGSSLVKTSPTDAMSGYVTPHGVRFLQIHDQPNDGTEIISACLWCTYHGAERENTVEVYVPVDNVIDFFSIRKYYQSDAVE